MPGGRASYLDWGWVGDWMRDKCSISLITLTWYISEIRRGMAAISIFKRGDGIQSHAVPSLWLLHISHPDSGAQRKTGGL